MRALIEKVEVYPGARLYFVFYGLLSVVEVVEYFLYAFYKVLGSELCGIVDYVTGVKVKFLYQ